MKLTHKTKTLLTAFIYFIGLFLIAVCWWADKFFGEVTIAQVVYTLKYGIDGVLASDPIFYKRFIKWCFGIPVLATLLVLLLTAFLKKFSFYYRISKIVPFIILIAGLSNAIYQFSVFGFIKNYLTRSKHDYFKLNYVDPHQITFKAKEPKSLILIYVESLEKTYGDKNKFGHDLLKNLHRFNGLSFAHYEQMPGTGWTIAGMVSSQCGVPLKTLAIFNGNHQGHMFNNFLGNAECLSDILAKNGYRNIFMNGPDLDFAGTNKFLQDHHFHEMYGKKEWLATGYSEDDMNPWGLYDDDLFKEAKIKLTQLMQSKQRFNLTLLTVDMHGYYGHLSKTCKKNGANDFKGIVECTANQLGDFIEFVSEKGWLDKVVIVIQGDHLSMKNPLTRIIELDQERGVFNLIITKKPLHKNTDMVTHFDMLPTMLSAMGFRYDGAGVGLGYSAISPASSIDRKARIEDMQNQISNYSETYNHLWQLD